jgi:hypothetical protein
MGVIIGSFQKMTPAVPSEAFQAAFQFPIASQAVAVALFFFARDYWER